MIRTGVIGELADPVWDAMYQACVAAVERTIAGMRPDVSTLELGEHAIRATALSCHRAYSGTAIGAIRWA